MFYLKALSRSQTECLNIAVLKSVHMKAGSNTSFNITEIRVCKTVPRLCHKNISLESLITVSLACVSIMLKCISMQNLINIYHAVQDL